MPKSTNRVLVKLRPTPAVAFRAAEARANLRPLFETRTMTESFGVDVTIPGMAPVNIRGFATQADAELWVAKHRVTVAAGPARRRVPFRSRPLVKAE